MLKEEGFKTEKWTINKRQSVKRKIKEAFRRHRTFEKEQRNIITTQHNSSGLGLGGLRKKV